MNPDYNLPLVPALRDVSKVKRRGRVWQVHSSHKGREARNLINTPLIKTPEHDINNILACRNIL
jgi:hypothetical protein